MAKLIALTILFGVDAALCVAAWASFEAARLIPDFKAERRGWISSGLVAFTLAALVSYSIWKLI